MRGCVCNSLGKEQTTILFDKTLNNWREKVLGSGVSDE